MDVEFTLTAPVGPRFYFYSASHSSHHQDERNAAMGNKVKQGKLSHYHGRANL